MGCLRGGAYFLSRRWYLDTLLGLWEELRGWGPSEGILSIANYMLGGKNVCVDVEIGRVFRPATSYSTAVSEALYNELFFAHVIVPDGPERQAFLAQTASADEIVTRTAWDLLDRSIHQWYGKYLMEKGRRTWADYQAEWMAPYRTMKSTAHAQARGMTLPHPILTQMQELFPDRREQGETKIRQSQLALLRMLQMFDFLARKHRLTYWLEAGTLLGAVRHQGFIPWDCNINLGMPRVDYETFVQEVVTELPHDIFWQSADTDAVPWYCSARLRDKYSCYAQLALWYPDIRWHQGLQITLLAYDVSVSRQETAQKRLHIRRERERHPSLTFEYAYALGDIFPLQYLEFEGAMYPCVHEYETYLQAKYGDYRQLPPAVYQVPSSGMPEPFVPCDHPDILFWHEESAQPHSEFLQALQARRLNESDPFNFFDAIYCINLDDRTTVWQKFTAACHALGIKQSIRRVSAVDTRALRNHHIGCALSHRNAIQDAKSRGYRNILVFEEDALLHENITEHLRNSLRELVAFEWDVFYLGGCRWGRLFDKPEGCQFLEIPEGMTCAHALAYSERVFDYMLHNVPDNPRDAQRWCETYAAIDQWAMYKLQGDEARKEGYRKIRSFISYPVLATQPFLLTEEQAPEKLLRLDDDLKPIPYILGGGITNLQNAPFLNKTRYEDCFPTNTAQEETYRLPKILHFVWITSPISQEYIELVRGFSIMNPHFAINLWLDHHSDIAKIKEENVHITVRNIEEVYDETFHSLRYIAFKIDYIRYLLVYNFGGIYCDIDTVANKPLDYLFAETFVSHTADPFNNIQNSFFGFAQHSHFLQYVIECFRYFRQIGRPEDYAWSGPNFFTNCFLRYNDNNIRLIHQDITMSGEDAYTSHMYHANWLKTAVKKIIVIGDSHAQLFDNDHERRRGCWIDGDLENLFDIRWMGPVTLWRLCRDQKSFIDFENDIKYLPFPGFREITTKAEYDQDIMLSLGEIDIRCHVIRHNNGNYRKVIDAMAENLDCYISQFYQRFKIHLMSVVPPMYVQQCISPNSDLPFIGSDEERRDATLYLNQKLFDISNKYNIGYFDAHKLYADDNNMLDIAKSDQIVHGMKTLELENYIKAYYGVNTHR